MKKLDLKLLDVFEFHMERDTQPMSEKRFEQLFWIILALIGAGFFIALFALN